MRIVDGYGHLVANWEVVVSAAAGLATTVIAVVGAVREGRTTSVKRANIARDVDLLAKLDPTSAVRAELMEYVDDRVRELIRGERDMVTDGFGAALGVAFAVSGAGVFISVARGASGLWMLLGVPLVLIGIAGLAVDGPKRERGSDGKAVRRERPKRAATGGRPE